METGLPGLCLAAGAVYLTIRQLLLHSQLHKENLLLSGVLYASCALGIQALVDFSLILPSVFVPYCVLLGAFLGRCRRIENERDRLDELGVADYDHRTIAKLPPRKPSRGKLLMHSLIAWPALGCMLFGFPELTGYSMADSLQQDLKRMELPVGGDVDAEAQYQRVAAACNALQPKVDEAVVRFSQHPEVSLLIGQFEQHLWRVEATKAIQWGEELPLSRRWELANPQVLSLILRVDDPSLSGIRERIAAHGLGMELGRDSQSRMQWSLAACPQDARAAWGMLVADCKKLTESEHAALLDLLSRLIGNNTQVMVEVAVIAIREGNVERGVSIFKQALALDWQRMTKENLAAVVRKLDRETLISMLPQDGVKQAEVVALLDRLVDDPVDPIPEARPLAEALSRHAYSLVTDLQAINPEQCRLLARLARRNHDLDLEIKVLQRLKLLQESDLASRFELVAATAARERTSGDITLPKGQLKKSEELLAELLIQYRGADRLIPYVPQSLLEQAYLIEGLEALRNVAGATELKDMLTNALIGTLRSTRAETVDQCTLWVELARGTKDSAAIIKQDRDLTAFKEWAQRMEAAQVLRSRGEMEKAVKEVRQILRENPPNSVREQCEKLIKNWSNR